MMPTIRTCRAGLSYAANAGYINQVNWATGPLGTAPDNGTGAQDATLIDWDGQGAAGNGDHGAGTADRLLDGCLLAKRPDRIPHDAGFRSARGRHQ